jgi:hypothetical protein
VALFAALAAGAAMARADGQAGATATAAPPARSATPGERRAVRDVAADLAASAGVTVVADSSIARVPVGAPATTVTAATLEGELDRIVREMPEGTRWVRVLLPESASRHLTGDAVAEYVADEARLYGAAPAGSVTILGQVVTKEQADAIIGTFALKPVYLIANDGLRAAAAARAVVMAQAAAWVQLTPVQQQRTAMLELAQLYRLDAPSWNGVFQDEMAFLRGILDGLGSAQRDALISQVGKRGPGIAVEAPVR